jgi:SAM-dependent methyltransferase
METWSRSSAPLPTAEGGSAPATVQYGALAAVYEWLLPDALLEPEGAVAAFHFVVKTLGFGARVLDCAAGTGQLAVGLALLGFDVVAADASAAMLHRARELAERRGMALHTATCEWKDLQHLNLEPFDAVFCVGNSLPHAAGQQERRAALAAMAAMLRPGGMLVLTSRNWELLRAARPGLQIADRLVERDGRLGLVVHAWQLGDDWDNPHRLDVAVALLGPDGSVSPTSERLVFWPFRHETLQGDLGASGLTTPTSTYAPDVERYLVTARRDASE